VIFGKLPSPVEPPREHYVAPATLDATQGKEAVDRAIKGSVLRPADIAETRLDEPVLIYAPFWRMNVAADGFSFGVIGVRKGNGPEIPIPIGGAKHKDAVIVVSGRTLVPYEPKLPSWLDKLGRTPPLEIGPNEVVPFAAAIAQEALAKGELVEADVSKEQAERLACGMLVRSMDSRHAIIARFTPQLRAAALVLYPLYYARYRYNGEARRHLEEDLFVAVSGRTGEVVSAKFPSAPRAVAAKIRRLLSFDRR
jgi:hypothetical protein